MNLLKQTALILGLTGLSLGAWTLFRDWRNKVSILFSALCFCVAVWAMSFVSHITLFGRLSYDIHRVCNVLIVPLALELIHRVFLKERGLSSRVIFALSCVGAAMLGLMVAFSLGSSTLLKEVILFFPGLIFLEFLRIMILDYTHSGSLRVDSITSTKKIMLYLGLGLTLSLCSFDHIPAFGFVLPAVGNLLFALYLFFTSQVIHPQKLLGLEALASRFFAVLTLSLIITGFFALLYSYLSSSFPLFLLNSFLISFSVLVLWGPLLTFFRYLARTVFRSAEEGRVRAVDEFRFRLTTITDFTELNKAASEFLTRNFQVSSLGIFLVSDGATLPAPVVQFFESLNREKSSPVLYREYLEREREQVLNQSKREELGRLIRFLRSSGTEAVYALMRSEKIEGWITLGSVGGIPAFNSVVEVLALVSECALRIIQLNAARERDRLILLGEMAAGLAHEIRNPLGAIRGAANLIDSGSDPWSRVIQEEVDRLNRLVSQFLDFSRDQKDSCERVDLNGLIPKILNQITPGLPERVRLEFKAFDGSVPVMVVPDSVQQVLVNLIQNSIKALEGRENPEIQVHTFKTGFSVRDTGTGMSSETLSRVFHPFFTSFKSGSGLGLSICEKLVRFDGGRVLIQSESGRGTEVKVEYPDAR
jgi:signal transduction histidine kinase